MYPHRFRYESPSSIEEAIALIQEGGGEAKILAGGQSLIPMMKLRFAEPEMIVDINNIPGLDYLDFGEDGSARVGALCRHSTLERSAELGVRQPTMAAAAPLVADPIVRNRGTMVGSLCHADPQGDWAAVMTALGGHLVAQGPSGRRSIPATELSIGPFENVLALDEIGVEATVPAASGTRQGGFLKLERRVGDFATVAVAVALEMTGSQVTKAGIGLAAVGATTIDAVDASGALEGSDLNDEVIDQAAEMAAAASDPSTDHRGSADYKRQVVRTFVARILNRIGSSMEKVA